MSYTRSLLVLTLPVPLVDLGPVEAVAACNLRDVLGGPDGLHLVLILELRPHLSSQPVAMSERSLSLLRCSCCSRLGDHNEGLSFGPSVGCNLGRFLIDFSIRGGR